MIQDVKSQPLTQALKCPTYLAFEIKFKFALRKTVVLCREVSPGTCIILHVPRLLIACLLRYPRWRCRCRAICLTYILPWISLLTHCLTARSHWLVHALLTTLKYLTLCKCFKNMWKRFKLYALKHWYSITNTRNNMVIPVLRRKFKQVSSYRIQNKTCLLTVCSTMIRAW